jgi:hypothetical protein
MNLALQRLKAELGYKISNLLSHVMRDFTDTMGASAFGMHNTFWNSFACEMG